MTLVQRLLILVGTLLAILVGVGFYGIALYHDAREASVKRDLGQTLSFVAAEYGRFVDHARDSLLIASLAAPRAVADAGMCQALIGSLRVPDFNRLARPEWGERGHRRRRSLGPVRADASRVGAGGLRHRAGRSRWPPLGDGTGGRGCDRP
jgi:hypothetical protein